MRLSTLSFSAAAIVLGAFALACSGVVPKEATLPVPDPSGHRYFAGDPDPPGQAAFITRTLAASREPSLRVQCASEEAYRVVLIASFVGDFIVRIERHGSTIEVVSKVFEGGSPSYFWGSVTYAESLEAYASGKVVGETRRSGSETEWARLQQLLAGARFWTVPSRDTHKLGVDGDTCVIEGTRDGRHRWLERWEPEGPLRELCDYMLSLRLARPAHGPDGSP